MLWVISILASHIKQIWTLIDNNVLTDLSWEGWLLTYISRVVLDTTIRRPKGNPFVWDEIRNITCINKKINPNNVRAGVHGVTALFEDYANVTTVKDYPELFSIFDANDPDSIDVIFFLPGNNLDDLDNIAEFIDIDNVPMFESRAIVCTNYTTPDTWSGKAFTCHGGIYRSWWMMERGSRICLKHPSCFYDILEEEECISMVAYVRMKNRKTLPVAKEFLKFIGGQNHINCRQHSHPLISTFNRSKRCCAPKKMEINVMG